MNEVSIIAFSAICVDYFSLPGINIPGGNSLNFAIQAKKLTTGKVSLAGFIGKDLKAELVLTNLTAAGVGIENLTQLDGITASNVIYNTPDGERYSKPGEWIDGVKDSAKFPEEVWQNIMSHSIIAVPYLDKNLDELFRRRNSRHFIIMDFLHYDDPELIQPYLDQVDIAFISPKPENLPKIREMAENSSKIVVSMLGAQGSIAFRGSEEYIQKAFSIKKIIDTTGCGDSYQAGFVCSYYADRDILKAMYNGTKVATEVLSHYGGVNLG